MDDPHWDIERKWRIARLDGEPVVVKTRELAKYKALALLGTAGLGKTVEARALAAFEESEGREVRWSQLAQHTGPDARELQEHLAQRTCGASSASSIFLDALDEAMVPLRRAGVVLQQWVEEKLRPTSARVRVTCRSAVWPSSATNALRDYAGEGEFCTAFLQPLSDEDIAAAARACGIDPAKFLAQVQVARAENLAQQPLTLKLLL